MRKTQIGTCNYDGCQLDKTTRGYCTKHYFKLRRAGVLSPLTPKTASERFWEKVDVRGPDDCWPFTANASRRGYGQFSDHENNYGAHRFAYEDTYGAIPAGLTVDHTCHNGSGCPGGKQCQHITCVNPAHLEAVTIKENTLRGYALTAINARKEECHRGHAFTPENTYVWTDGRGGSHRICRECNRLRQMAYRHGGLPALVEAPCAYGGTLELSLIGELGLAA